MNDRRKFRKLLEMETPVLVRGTLTGEIVWPLPLHSSSEAVEISGLGAAVDERRRNVPAAEAWAGVALLANWAPTPFTIGGLACVSVESFYHALKYAEDSNDRQRVAALSGVEAQHAGAHRRGSTFQFRGVGVAVNSPDHAAIIAEAVVAKVAAHPEVRAVLDATGDAELVFPYGLTGRNVLAQASPLALMIERARRFRPAPY